jgi:hypothetical protein
VRQGSLLALLAIAACSQDAPSNAKPKPVEATLKLAGVFPDEFHCESITTLDALGQVLEGTARVIDTPMTVPRGVPKPCNYELQTTRGAEYWTYDFDCRDDYKARADALFVQYREQGDALVQQYNALADAGIKPTDAGIAIHAPERAAEVDVGAKGLDHHGQGLLFIDDDAPCYVRVVGPDPLRRLELAKLIAKNLTFDNAPMTPRPRR